MTATLRLWLRRERWALIGWTIGVAAVVAFVTIFFVAEAGTPQEAARFAASLQPVALSLEPMLGDAPALDTAGGFITWRTLGFLPLILGVFSLLLAVRMTAGEEARGTTDLALSTPLQRTGFMLGLGAALLACNLVIGTVGVAAGVAGADLGGGGLRLVDGIWQGLGVGLVAWVWAACAGLVAQRARSRVAARAFTALLMIACYLITNLSRTSSFFAPLRWISPFTAYRASRPLVPGWEVDVPALVVLLVVGVGLWGVAVALFARRDLGVRDSAGADVAATERGMVAGAIARSAAASARVGGRHLGICALRRFRDRRPEVESQGSTRWRRCAARQAGGDRLSAPGSGVVNPAGVDRAPLLLWFRRDLRLADNPALDAALRSERPVLPVFVWPSRG